MKRYRVTVNMTLEEVTARLKEAKTAEDIYHWAQAYCWIYSQGFKID